LIVVNAAIIKLSFSSLFLASRQSTLIWLIRFRESNEFLFIYLFIFFLIVIALLLFFFFFLREPMNELFDVWCQVNVA
jgi:hypothetical protein